VAYIAHRASHPQYGGQLIGFAFADQRVEPDELSEYCEEHDPERDSIRVVRSSPSRSGGNQTGRSERITTSTTSASVFAVSINQANLAVRVLKVNQYLELIQFEA
jgi:hypothetical protein